MAYKDPKDPRKREATFRYLSRIDGFLRDRFTGSRRRAIRPQQGRSAIDWNLTWEQFMDTFWSHLKRFGYRCRYCGIRMTNSRGHTHYGGKYAQLKTNVSMDRICSGQGYQPGNIVFCCIKCNDRKNSVTVEDCKKILKVYEEEKSSREAFEAAQASSDSGQA